MHGRITLQDFAANDDDDDSNASDDDFKMDEEYQDEVNEEIVLEEEEGSVGNYDPDLQEDYFQNPIQQHNIATNDNNEPVPVILDNRTRSANNPIVNLTNATRPTTKQECRSVKKKKRYIVEEETAMAEEDLEEDPVIPGSTITDEIEVTNDTVVDVEPDVPNELKSDLGSYWVLAQSSYAHVLNTISSYGVQIYTTVWIQQRSQRIWGIRIRDYGQRT
jgi:hypothetical protein